MSQTVVDIDSPSAEVIIGKLNTSMSPYWRFEKDATDVANSDTYKLEMHSPDGNFRMPFATNANKLDMEAPRA